MNTSDKNFNNERVVQVVETCDGSLSRTYYCIHDLSFGHWMSREPFDGLIWTRDTSYRQEFANRMEAEAALETFLDWRREQEANDEIVTDIPWDRNPA